MDQDHIMKVYDEELRRLDQLIAEMGGLAESQLADAVEAMVRRDGDLARKVAERDQRIDALERDVDALTMRVLALRQPMAEDLRSVIAALKSVRGYLVVWRTCSRKTMPSSLDSWSVKVGVRFRTRSPNCARPWTSCATTASRRSAIAVNRS